MRVLRFQLLIETAPEGGYHLRALSPRGEGRARFVPPPCLAEVMTLEAALGRDACHLSYDGAEEGARSLVSAGEQLFAALFQGEILRLYERCLDLLEEDLETRLRLEILLDPHLAALHQLPWELLRQPGTPEALALSRRRPFVRYLTVPRPIYTASRPTVLRILAVSSDPRHANFPPLDLVRELRNLREAVGINRDRAIEIVEPQAPTLAALRKALLENECHVFHFMGHGGALPGHEERLLYFENETGEVDPVRGLDLANKLGDFPYLRLAVLNACGSAAVPVGAYPANTAFDPFAGVATSLVLGGIPAVVAMRLPISDTAAISFSRALYHRLAAGDPVDVAVTEGRQAVHSAAPASFEWATPVLFMRTPNGELYQEAQNCDNAQLKLNLDAYQERLSSRLLVRGISYAKLDVDLAVTVARQNLRPMPNSRLALTEAISHHNCLVMLGGAGAGKTTTLLSLAGSILRGEPQLEGLSDRIAIFIELGRFRASPTLSPLDCILTLIANALFLDKASPRPLSLEEVRNFLLNHRVVLLLDGLNEIQAGLRADCLSSIVDLAQLYSHSRYIVSSRPQGFVPPESWEVAFLRELDDEQIPEFLARHTDLDRGLRLFECVLEARNPLLRLPLFLSLFVTMRNSRLGAGDAGRRLRSRSGLVAEYAELLLHRDLPTGGTMADSLALGEARRALEHLAWKLQGLGQMLSSTEALEALMTIKPQGATLDEARRSLSDLCDRGLMNMDSDSLRFWHHTLQEYFYAGYVVRRWRESKSRAGRLPSWLLQLTDKAEEQEALGYIAAYISDEEACTILEAVLAKCPTLALMWADDLILEGRAQGAVDSFMVTTARFSSRAHRYSRLGSRSNAATIVLTAGFLLSAMTCFLLEYVKRRLLHIDIPGTVSLVTPKAIFLASFPIASLLMLYFHRHYPSAIKLEILMTGVAGVRSPSLKSAMIAIVNAIGQSRLSSKRLIFLAKSNLSSLEIYAEQNLAEVIRTSHLSIVNLVSFFALLDSPSLVPAMGFFLKSNNYLSRTAIEILGMRARRVSKDRSSIHQLLRSVELDRAMDARLRLMAGITLLRDREGRRYWTPASLAYIRGELPARLLLMVLCVLVSSLILRAPYLYPKFLAFSSLSSIIVWLDARRLNAKEIFGCQGIDCRSAAKCALTCFLAGAGFAFINFWTLPIGMINFWPLAIIDYTLNRSRIRRNSEPVDWSKLSSAITGST